SARAPSCCPSASPSERAGMSGGRARRSQERNHETHHRHHQAVQARRGPRGPFGDRGPGRHRHRSEGVRSPEGPYRALPWRRVRRRLPSQGQGRGGRRRRARRPGRRGDRERRPHRQDRRRQDLRLRPRAGRPHPHRRDRRDRNLSAPRTRNTAMTNLIRKLCLPAALLLSPALSHAQAAAGVAAVVDKGDVAWMMTATLLVLFMAMPGIGLFYGGMVRAKNTLSVLMQVTIVFCLIALLWTVYGYSVAFTE